ncbi:site-specific integrase [Nocardia puris]|uniref:site-specific integrase n=1 Tax=Nocardia puris TaxID=208602 RepID=UPI001E45F069|nr:site-specific integrase [Nocardia puris]
MTTLADALVQRSADRYPGWGEVVIFAACTASRIGEVSGCRVGDIDTDTWTWRVRRQTTPGPGGLEDKGTKGNRARHVPLIDEVRQLVSDRLDAVGRDNPDPGCSVDLGAGGSLPVFCGMPRTGMRWLRHSGMSICGGTISVTPV